MGDNLKMKFEQKSRKKNSKKNGKQKKRTKIVKESRKKWEKSKK